MEAIERVCYVYGFGFLLFLSSILYSKLYMFYRAIQTGIPMSVYFELFSTHTVIVMLFFLIFGLGVTPITNSKINKYLNSKFPVYKGIGYERMLFISIIGLIFLFVIWPILEIILWGMT